MTYNGLGQQCFLLLYCLRIELININIKFDSGKQIIGSGKKGKMRKSNVLINFMHTFNLFTFCFDGFLLIQILFLPHMSKSYRLYTSKLYFGFVELN